MRAASKNAKSKHKDFDKLLRRFSEGRISGSLSELLDIIAILRSKCPWDREQRIEDIKYKLVEEAYEAIDKFDKANFEEFASELGDVLLVVFFMIKIMEEEGKFDSRYVLKELIRKLIARHPHVFGDKKLETPDSVLRNWEKMKGDIKKDELNLSMPALYLAYRVIEKIRNRQGCRDANIKEEILKRISEGVSDLTADAQGLKDKISRIFFELTALCVLEGINPEDEVRKFVTKLIEKLDSVRALDDLIALSSPRSELKSERT